MVLLTSFMVSCGDDEDKNGNNSNNKTNYVYDNITGKLVITTSNQDDKGNAIYTNGNNHNKLVYSSNT